MIATPQLPEYNGWPNYPTWAIHQGISNDEQQCQLAEQIAIDTGGDTGIAADNLQAWVAGMIEETTEGVSRDLATFAAGLCDWRYLADSLIRDIAEATALAAGLGDWEDSPAGRAAGW